MVVGNIKFTSGTDDIRTRYQSLKNNNSPIIIKDVPKELDDYIMKKNELDTIKVQLGLFAGGSALGSIVTEGFVSSAKKQLANNSKELADKIKSLRALHVSIPAMLGLTTLFAYFDTKTRKKTGIITKEAIYKSQGFNVENSQKTNQNLKVSKTEYALMGIGAGLVGINALFKGKFKIPIIQSNLFENKKVVNTICDAAINGVALAGVYTVIKSFTNGNKQT